MNSRNLQIAEHFASPGQRCTRTYQVSGRQSTPERLPQIEPFFACRIHDQSSTTQAIPERETQN